MYVGRNSGWVGLGALNCPGDPGCPGYTLPDSTGHILTPLEQLRAEVDALWEYTQAGTAPVYTEDGGVLPSPTKAPSKEWIAGIPNIAVGLGGAAVGMMLIGMMTGRR